MDATTGNTSAEKRKAQSVLKNLKVLREAQSTLTVTDLVVLLVVASSPGCRVSKIEEVGEMGKATAWQALQRLLAYNSKRGEDGLGWAVLEPSPEDGRAKECHLTPTGKAFVSVLMKGLTGD